MLRTLCSGHFNFLCLGHLYVQNTSIITSCSLCKLFYSAASLEDDFSLSASNVTFEVGSNRECLNVLLEEDDIFELIEVLSVSITSTIPSVDTTDTFINLFIEDTTGGKTIALNVRHSHFSN